MSYSAISFAVGAGTGSLNKGEFGIKVDGSDVFQSLWFHDGTSAKRIDSTATGTVTSVGIAAPALMTASGTPVVGAGTLTLTWDLGSGAPRPAVIGVSQGSTTPGWVAVSGGGVMLTPDGSGGLIWADDAGSRTAIGAVGTARTISAGAGLSGGGSLAADRTIALAATGVSTGTYGSGSTTGAFTLDAYGRVTAATDTAIAIAASQIASGTIAGARMPALSGDVTSAAGSTVTALSTVTAAKGGTGQTSYTLGDLLYASGASALSKLSGNTTTTRRVLTETGDGTNATAPVWVDFAFTSISGSATASQLPTGGWITRAANRVTGTLASDFTSFSTPSATWVSSGVTLTLQGGAEYEITIQSRAVITGTGTILVRLYNQTDSTTSGLAEPVICTTPSGGTGFDNSALNRLGYLTVPTSGTVPKIYRIEFTRVYSGTAPTCTVGTGTAVTAERKA